MAIVQRNLYLPGRDLTNLAQNVDLNRIGMDLTDISIAFGAPSVVTVAAGSMIECNGNIYVLTTDETFNMGGGHNYITFTDNPAPAFASAAAQGTYSALKGGFYQADNVTRTLKWFIDQTGEGFNLNLNILVGQNYNLYSGMTSAVRAWDQSTNASGVAFVVPYDTEVFDVNNEYDPGTYTFTPRLPGLYYISSHVRINDNKALNQVFLQIEVNAVARAWGLSTRAPIAVVLGIGVNVSALLNLNGGDAVQIKALCYNNTSALVIGVESSVHLSIFKLI